MFDNQYFLLLLWLRTTILSYKKISFVSVFSESFMRPISWFNRSACFWVSETKILFFENKIKNMWKTFSTYERRLIYIYIYKTIISGRCQQLIRQRKFRNWPSRFGDYESQWPHRMNNVSCSLSICISYSLMCMFFFLWYLSLSICLCVQAPIWRFAHLATNRVRVNEAPTKWWNPQHSLHRIVSCIQSFSRRSHSREESERERENNWLNCPHWKKRWWWWCW